jgi:tetratricopeptide (TPR) repeat protein
VPWQAGPAPLGIRFNDGPWFMALNIPLALRNALEAGQCTLFLGAGIGHHVAGPDGSEAPDAQTLAEELAGAYGIEIGDQRDLAKVAQAVVARKGRPELELFLTKRLTDLEPDDTLLWLLSRTWRAIFTTNYDRVIQRAYEKIATPTQRPVTIAASADLVPMDPKFDVPIYHLHGSLFEGDHRLALITTTDYARFREHRAMMFEVLKLDYATSPILYVGYSNQDPNWSTVIAELESEFSPSQPPESYRVAPGTSPLDVEVLRVQNVTTLDGSLEDFEAAFRLELGDLVVEPYSISNLEKAIPSDLLEVFHASPVALSRLLRSWTYANQADLSGHPNTADYLRGDRPNWALIAQGIPFERDLEEPVFEELLDFATLPEALVRSVAVLGPAGYGTTTLLMRLAAMVVGDRAGTALFQRPGASLIEGDIEFAAQSLPQPLFFFVDNAADSGPALPAAMGQLRSASRGACFVLGERINEWRQRNLRVRPREYMIEPLSDGEIDRLLECLTLHGALGVLSDLPADLRVAAIRIGHRKELLVAMLEATEGRAFSAIIEDEFRGIDNDLARSVYGTVAAFDRLRAESRETLLASVLDVPVTEIYEVIKSHLQGVVLFEDAGDSTTTLVRTRHHVIADIVWHRCIGLTDREALLLTVMKKLNLNYGSDVRAFESMVRADDAIDAVGSLESRVEFFEQACRKDPLSPYVRQHYARMLRRAKQFDGALEQIKVGLELDDSVRVLYHTKGVILADMANQAASAEIGRRRVVQSEDAFEQVLRLNPRDEYGYQGLAQLYLDWARRAPTPEESAVYLRKCEETVDRGLSTVNDREALWIVSSDIADFLGDAPGVLEALEKAIRENPQAGFARYLLAQKYLADARLDDAEKIIKPALKDTPDNYRAALIYARVLHLQGRPYAECIAVLRLGEDTGSQDARFVAALVGMLTMGGEPTEAQKVIVRARQSLGAAQANRVQFTASPGGSTLRLVGVVQKVRPGYTFIRAAGYSDFFFLGSKFGDVAMREGMSVEFTAAFSARGPVAIDLAEADQS